MSPHPLAILLPFLTPLLCYGLQRIPSGRRADWLGPRRRWARAGLRSGIVAMGAYLVAVYLAGAQLGGWALPPLLLFLTFGCISLMATSVATVCRILEN